MRVRNGLKGYLGRVVVVVALGGGLLISSVAGFWVGGMVGAVARLMVGIIVGTLVPPPVEATTAGLRVKVGRIVMVGYSVPPGKLAKAPCAVGVGRAVMVGLLDGMYDIVGHSVPPGNCAGGTDGRPVGRVTDDVGRRVGDAVDGALEGCADRVGMAVGRDVLGG